MFIARCSMGDKRQEGESSFHGTLNRGCHRIPRAIPMLLPSVLLDRTIRGQGAAGIVGELIAATVNDDARIGRSIRLRAVNSPPCVITKRAVANRDKGFVQT